MRKFVILGICCAASVALLGLSAAAHAGTPVVDQDCDGSPYSNNYAVNGFDVSTSSSLEHDFTSMTAGGVACGTTLNPSYFLGVLTGCDTSNTLHTNFDFRMPPGMEINPTAGMPSGAYVGTATGRVAVALVPVTCGISAGSTVVTVETNDGNDDCPDSAVACYKATASVGYGFVWITGSSGSGYQMNIGPIHAPAGSGGFTQFSVSLCQNIGVVDGTSCGATSAPWVTKTGNVSTPPSCSDGNGRFQLRVQRQSGEFSPFATDCVGWSARPPATTTDPDCTGTNPNATSRPYDNSFKAREFSVETVDGDGDTANHTAGANASLRTKALICSTALQASNGGIGTITDHVDLLEARGFGTSNTFSMENGSYAGKIAGRIAYHDAGGAAHVETATANLRIDPLDIRWLEGPVDLSIQDGCNRDPDNPSSGGVAGRGIVGLNAGVRATWDGGVASIVFACFKATGTITSGPNAGQPWHAWVWKTQGGFPTGACNPGCVDGYGRQYLTIGPIHLNNDPTPTDSNDAETGPPAGLTDISQFRVCGYLGAVGGNACGDNTRPVLHSNGTAFGAGCGDTDSAYQLRAVRRDTAATDQLNRPFPNWIYADCVGEPARGGGRGSVPCTKRKISLCRIQKVDPTKVGSPTRQRP